MVEDDLERADPRVEPRRQRVPIGVHVDDRLARDARIHRRLSHRHRHGADQPRIERHRDDVVGAIARPFAGIGGRNLVRHVLAGKPRQRLGRRDLHRVVDGARPHVQRAAEDVREAEHVVDLVGIVRATGRDDRVLAQGRDLLRRDLRIGVGHRKDDRPVGHRQDHFRRHRALGRQAEEHIGAAHRVLQRARVGRHRVGRLPLVHALRAPGIDHALGVAQDRVIVRQAHRLDQLQARDAGRAGAVADDLDVLDRAAGEVERVEQPGGGDDRRAVLVVVEDRDVHHLAQPILDDEAIGRLDVLEVDAAEAGAEIADAVDERLDVGRVDLDVDRIDVGEALEQDRLALHHRLRRQRAEIAEAEDRRTVGDHRDDVAARGVVIGRVRIFGDRQHRHRDARRIGQRQVALGRHRFGGHNLELARPSLGMEQQGLLLGKLRARPRGALGRRHLRRCFADVAH